MRKFVFFLLTLMSVPGLSACGNQNPETPPVTWTDISDRETEQAELSISAGNNDDTGVSGGTMADQTIIDRQDFEAAGDTRRSCLGMR